MNNIGVTPLDDNYYEVYKSTYGCNESREYANGIDYSFITRKDDGWIGIFEFDPYTGRYFPRIEAVDYNKALNWINMIERLTVPVSPIC